jgi:hypothetical protein
MDTKAIPRRSRAVLWGVGAAVVTAIIVAVFAWLGVVNGDEGWYVLGARSVAHGHLQYRDFAFTQGPGYLYVLAPFMRLLPRLYTARAVSVACTAVSIGLLVAMARRVGGKWAALAASAALLATVPSLPYWLSITKTYALSCLFLAAILFTLTSAVRPAVRYPLAAALAVGLAETRTTGVALAAMLIVALLVQSPDTRTRRRIVLASAVTALPFVFLVFSAWQSARWGLFEYHQLGATGGTGIFRFVSRTGAAILAWPGPFLLGALATVVTLFDPQLRSLLKRRLDLTAFVVGVVLFVFLHEASAVFFSEEYLVPVIAPIVVLSTVMLMRAATGSAATAKRRGSTVIHGLLIAAIVVTAFTGGHRYYVGMPGWGGNPAGMKALTRCVQRYSAPRDTVFALQLEEVVAESGRQPVRSVSLGAFSYQNVSTKRAKQLKILNAHMLGTLFTHRPPKLLVLTVDDIFETKRAGRFSKRRVANVALYSGFSTYHPVCKVKVVRHVFVNSPVLVTVYGRGPD